MNYVSVCSGIEAATQAWHPLGWTPVAFSEIEKFPSAVLAHHYPAVPNWGDMTKFKEWPDAKVDVLVGGTPCQSFSVAGLRAGLADPRGNLALTYLAIAERYRPEWLVWENVPGVLSSDGGRAMGSILGAMAKLGYGFAYRVLDAQYVRTSRFRRAVPQRRRRVFVVAHLGDWRRAAAVLFDAESLRGNPPPSREAGQASPTIPSRSTAGGGLGTDFDCDGGLIPEVANPLTHRMHKGINTTADEEQTPVPVAFDTTQVTSAANYSNPKPGDPCHPLAAGAHPPAVAIQERAVSENPENGPDGKGWRDDGAAFTVEARQQQQAVAFDMRGRHGGAQPEGPHDTANIRAASGGSSRSYVAHPMAVRRLTPVECERLQGFPDGFTAIPWRGRPAEECPDGPRYKALGNSMSVNVMRWIGDRIAKIEAET